MNANPLRAPSALVPLAMSLVALGMVVVYVAIHGVVHHADEGTPARIFQLLMVGQLPVVAYFAVKWVPQAPRKALGVLALQACAWIAAVGTVYWLEM